MATRDLTAHFMQLRALYSKPQGHGFDDDDFYDDELAHFNAQAFGRDKELTRSASAQSEWIQLIHEMRELVASLNKKLHRLEAMHREHLTPRFGKDPLLEEQRIESLTEDIKLLFSECKNRMEELHSRHMSGTELPSQHLEMKRNSKIAMATELSELSKRFRVEQREYMQQLKILKERRRELTVMDHVSQLSADEEAQVEELEYRVASDQTLSEDNIHDILANQQDIIRRDKEIREILRSIIELQDLFREFSDIVIEQGTLVDRIDYNLEHTMEHIAAANEELREVEKGMSANTKITGCLLILIVVFIILSIIFASKLMLK